MHSPTGPAKTPRADLQSIYDNFLGQRLWAQLCYTQCYVVGGISFVFRCFGDTRLWSSIAASPVDSLFYNVSDVPLWDK